MSATAFSRLHPITSFLYFVGVISMAMFLQHPIYLACGLILSFCVLRLHLRVSKRFLVGYLLLLILMIFLNPIFVRNGSTTLFSIFKFSFTLEAVMYGLKSGILILIMLLAFNTFNSVISSTKLLYLFSKLFPRGAMLLALALRFVPLFKNQIQQIDEIQATKGLSVREGSLRNRAKAGMIYMQVLLVFSLEEALQTANSMKARGYSGKHTNRTAYQYYRFTKTDILTIIFFVLCTVIVVTGKFHGFGDFIFFPKLASIGLTGQDFLFLASFILFIGYPLFMEGGSRIKWHYLHLKI